jgi:ElaB/YqjD/DUF883 family membrane-anchored ribosome-binding protein
MAAANRNLEEEFDTLKAGPDTLRKDISSLVSSFGDTATDEVKTRGRRARAAVGRATDRAGEVWDDATNEASRRGREGVAAVKQQIEERPFISVLVPIALSGPLSAFGLEAFPALRGKPIAAHAGCLLTTETAGPSEIEPRQSRLAAKAPLRLWHYDCGSRCERAQGCGGAAARLPCPVSGGGAGIRVV